jgi:hypothetical protein
VRRTTLALLVLPILALTGCGPTTDDIRTMVNGSAKAYDALALREDVVGAGVECAGTNQLPSPGDPGTTFLDCGTARWEWQSPAPVRSWRTS